MSGQTMIPPGVAFLVNLVRIGRDELAKSFVFHVQVPADAAMVAASVGAKAAGITDSDVTPDRSLVITLNLVDGNGRGGVSWQCLTFTRRVPCDQLATAVAGVVNDMVLHACGDYLAELALAATPAPNAPTSHEVQ